MEGVVDLVHKQIQNTKLEQAGGGILVDLRSRYRIRTEYGVINPVYTWYFCGFICGGLVRMVLYSDQFIRICYLVL